VPLTPADVRSKQFKIARRGYALEEVDSFLDEVEGELARLLRDHNDQQTRAPEPAPAAVPAPPAAEPEPASRPIAQSEGQEAALRTLLLAQRTADEAVAEARAEAEQIVTAARDEAEQTLTAARDEAESTLGTARQKAGQVDQEVAARIHAATGNLDQRRIQLEHHIEELRAFEREYRTRLKAYLETQLRDLTGRGGPDDDGGAGVPVGARSAAVGLAPGGAAGVTSPQPAGAGPAADVGGTADRAGDTGAAGGSSYER
jgi:DivIVA domain-containing protein